MMSFIKNVAFAILFAISSISYAASPTALVEDVSNAVTPVQLLDFLAPGDEIDLGAEGSLVLGYLESCVREEITGGMVKVGSEQSEVANGKVDRSQTQCDGGSLSLAANQSVQSGAMAFRVVDSNVKSELTIHDISPVLLLPKGGKVTIKRIDQKGERHKFRLEESDSRVKLDLAEQGIELEPGAMYMLSNGGRNLVFTVAENSGHSPDNLLGRLIPL